MNKCIFLGNIAKDIDLRFAAGTGMAVAKFSLALQRMKKDDGADFINIIAFGKTGETIAQYFQKGSKILLECRVQTGSYNNQEGKKVFTTDFVVERFEFVQSANKNNNNSNNNNNNNNNSFNNDDMTPIDDEDIPF